ncbi:hypothetical protein PG996_010619 [Apiospora saccharicola]|uniref:Uncharacterized protein n=1 Tax=Apiospora saccharicola TaxID=335842 RepID=A0ABR1UP52_9PEZI
MPSPTSSQQEKPSASAISQERAYPLAPGGNATGTSQSAQTAQQHTMTPERTGAGYQMSRWLQEGGKEGPWTHLGRNNNTGGN